MATWNEEASHSANLGDAPFHATACADAENVNDGSTTGPVISSARSASMRPVVHDETAITCGTPRYSAARRSSSATSCPFVNDPRFHESERISVTRSSVGAGGRTKGIPSGKATSPPSIASLVMSKTSPL